MDRLLPQDPIELGDWKIIARLATSDNSTIYLGHKGIEGSEQAAIKVLSDEISSDLNAVDRLKIEAEALKKISNPYIAKLLDYSFDNKPIWIATEYIDRKTLDTKLKQDGTPITGQEWWQLAAKIFNGLKAIHSEKIIHKDIKPANIIVSNEQVKIIDFGISYVPGNTRTVDFSKIEFEGSRPFAAPENFRANASVSEKMDVFSAAVTLAYAGRLRSIWNDEDEGSLRNSIFKEKPNLTGLEPEQIELLEPLLDKFPSQRPSSEEAFKKITQYIEFLVGISESRPTPLKGSAFTYRMFRNKKFKISIAFILALVSMFLIFANSSETIYVTNTLEAQNPLGPSSKPDSPTVVFQNNSSSIKCENAISSRTNVYDSCLEPAKAGDLKAVYFLAEDRYSNGLFTEAEKWYLIGAAQEDYSSIYGLIKTYQMLGNNEARSKWLEKCAKAYYGINDMSPKSILGFCKTLYGFDLLSQNKDQQAILYFRDAVSYKDGAAAVALSIYYRDNGNLVQQQKWLEEGAKLDNKDALAMLVDLLESQGKSEEAIKWISISANNGDLNDAANLALIYLTKKDYANAANWAKKCISSGISNCNYVYGVILYDQDGQKKLGKEYLIKAANQSNDAAIDKLGRVFWRDESDYQSAEMWFRKLADKNDYRGTLGLFAVLLEQVKIKEACIYSSKATAIAKELKSSGKWKNAYDESLASNEDFRIKFCAN
jgi:serine/threonine protein kinase